MEFDLQGQAFVELHHLLKFTGLCHSGGTAKRLIAEGLVRVDGAVELRKRCKVRQGQLIEFQGEEIRLVDQPS